MPRASSEATNGGEALRAYPDDAIVRNGALFADTPPIRRPFTPPVVARRVRERLDGAPHATEAVPVALA